MKNINKFLLLVAFVGFLMLPVALSGMTGWAPKEKNSRKEQALRLRESSLNQKLISRNLRQNTDTDLLNSSIEKP